MIGIILIFAFLAFCCLFLLLSFSQKKKLIRDSRHEHLSQQLTKLSQEHFILNRTLDIFSELEVDYFLTLNNSGYPELKSIEQALSEALETSNKFLQMNNYNDLQAAIEFLYVCRGNSNVPACLSSEKFSKLVNWGDKAKQLVTQLAQEISQSSSALKEVGSEARRTRKKTTMLLNQATLSLESL